MTFIECITTLIQRPGYLGVLADRRVITINKAGYILDATKPGAVYVRLQVQDMLAVVWECWTPEQLQAMAERAANGG